MNTSTIQDLTRVDSSLPSSSPRTRSSASDSEGFKNIFESELSFANRKRPDLKSSTELTAEAQAGLSLPVSDSQVKPEVSSTSPHDNGNENVDHDSSTAGKNETKEMTGGTDPDAADKTPGKKGAITENGKAMTGDEKETGKNVSPSTKGEVGEAKNAVRPTLPAGEKLTYGNVRKTENAMIGAGSAVSSSIQAVNVHHGTAHASSAFRPDHGSPNQGSDRSGKMTSNVMNNATSNKATMENEAFKMDMLSGMKPVSGLSSFSSSASFSNGQFDDGGQFSGKEGQGLQEVQITSKPHFVVPTSTSQMVDSIRKMQSMIQDQVMVLKSINHQSMQVMIRPDANMSLLLTLQQGESEVLVAARMDGQTSGLLKPHWAELQKELEQHGIHLGDPEAQYEEQSRGRQWDQSGGEQEDYYGSQAFFLSPNESSEDSKGNIESIHVLDPDFENTQGTLVSWA